MGDSAYKKLPVEAKQAAKFTFLHTIPTPAPVTSRDSRLMNARFPKKRFVDDGFNLVETLDETLQNKAQGERAINEEELECLHDPDKWRARHKVEYTLQVIPRPNVQQRGQGDKYQNIGQNQKRFFKVTFFPQ